MGVLTRVLHFDVMVKKIKRKKRKKRAQKTSVKIKGHTKRARGTCPSWHCQTIKQLCVAFRPYISHTNLTCPEPNPSHVPPIFYVWAFFLNKIALWLFFSISLTIVFGKFISLTMVGFINAFGPILYLPKLPLPTKNISWFL